MKRRVTFLSVCLMLIAGPGQADTAADPARLPAAPVWSPQAGDEIRFDVLRKGRPFGTHVVSFDVTAEGSLVARTQVKLRAGLGPIPLYRYDLEATERWRDGRLVALNGRVNDAGRKGTVEARLEGDVMTVDGTAYTGAVPAPLLPASHWNRAQTRAKTLLSSGDGTLIDVRVTPLGRERVDAAGQTVGATKYELDSEIDVTLWYDDRGRWVKLAFTVRGQDIEYVLAEPY